MKGSELLTSDTNDSGAKIDKRAHLALEALGSSYREYLAFRGGQSVQLEIDHLGVDLQQWAGYEDFTLGVLVLETPGLLANMYALFTQLDREYSYTKAQSEYVPDEDLSFLFDRDT